MHKEMMISTLVEKHGYSEDEAEKMYENAIYVISSAIEAFDRIKNIILEAAETILEYFTEQPQLVNSTSWIPVLDTRKDSQVMLNKPRFMVRKII